MRKLTYYIASSIDGFIASPDGDFGFYLLEGDHMAALIEQYGDMIPTHVRGFVGLADTPARDFDTVLMGRATYEVGLKEGFTSPYGHLRQFVFSASLGESPDPAVTVVSGDALAKVRELKQEPGKAIWLCGGGVLAQQLMPEIDELVIKLNPVTAGAGLPLFAGEFGPRAWRLTAPRVFESGVVLLTYVRA